VSDKEIVYGESIIADKEADLNQLKNEVDQIRAIMSTIRASQDQFPERASTVLSHLHHSQDGIPSKEETPILKRLGMMSHEFQPALQMFQSMSQTSDLSTMFNKNQHLMTI
jgi:hypothetical protein